MLSGNGPSVAEAWARLNGDAAKPMLNRAVRQTYPPGSTFKVVTAAAALDAGVVRDLDARTRSPAPYTLPGTTTSLSNEVEGCENASLRYAFEWSCNTVFAKLGVDVGLGAMTDTTRAFGFNDSDLRIPFSVAPSSFNTDMDRAQLALSSIGQYDTRATPSRWPSSRPPSPTGARSARRTSSNAPPRPTAAPSPPPAHTPSARP